MSGSPDWTSSFLVASVLLGEPIDVAAAVAGDALTPGARALAEGLRSASRDVRVRAIARVAAALALEVERSGLA